MVRLSSKLQSRMVIHYIVENRRAMQMMLQDNTCLHSFQILFIVSTTVFFFFLIVSTIVEYALNRWFLKPTWIFHVVFSWKRLEIYTSSMYQVKY